MRIAMLGTRGVPARYGGFETAVEEIGKRLAAAGNEVIVYARPSADQEEVHRYLGMYVVPRPSIHTKSLETLSHSAVSVGHVVARSPVDVAFLFNAANAMYLPALRARRIPVATHMDGLEWQRAKWGGAGRRFYRLSESIAVRYSDALIADAKGIADYYREEFGAACEQIAYGAPIVKELAPGLLPRPLTSRSYHLVVARFEPENHVLEIVRGYSTSRATLPLVVVGSAPYAESYSEAIERVAQSDPRIIMAGPVWDQSVLDQLYANALTYVHGHSVGGTNPSLLRAMGAGTAVIAWDVTFNREVAGPECGFFSTERQLAALLTSAEADPGRCLALGQDLQERASTNYNWDDVATAYSDLAERLRAGASRRGRATGRRNRDSGWSR